MKEKFSIFNLNLPVIFLIILLFPAINSITGAFKFERKNENRVFTDSIKVKFSHLDPLPKNIESYINDNFSFRTPLLDLYHHLKFSFFKVSPHPDQVIVGKENWFYLSGEEKAIFEGKRDFSDSDLQNFLTEWKKRKRYLDSLHIKTYWLIAPIKHNVYPEYLPFNVKKPERRRVSQLKDFLNENLPGLNIMDPLPEFLAAKDSMRLYYQLDNHWNNAACNLISKLLVDRIKADFPDSTFEKPQIQGWEEIKIKLGIHYTAIGDTSLFEIAKYPKWGAETAKESQKYGFPLIPGFAFPDLQELRYTQEAGKSGLRLLMIRDSFGNQVISYLKESFKESVFIWDAWDYKLNEPIVERVKPDVMVFLIYEAHMNNIIKNYPKSEL